jgi:2'-5' RNA ligase
MRPGDPNWFIALTVEPGEWYTPLLRTIPRHIRAFNGGDLHITVAFLRTCGEAKARVAWEAVAPFFTQPLEMTLGAVEPMGNRWRPSAIAICSATVDSSVGRFIDQTRDLATFKAGVEPELRAPRPHVTVIRPPKRGSLEEIREILDWASGTAPLDLPLRFSRLALYTRSVERGRQFQTVEEKFVETPGSA